MPQAVAPLLSRAGDASCKVVGDEIGDAAAIKMIRSVMIKGIEALTLECFLAAQRAGVVEEVTASLKNNYPGARLDEDVRLQPRAHGEPRRAPRRRDGRVGRHACANSASTR